MHTATPRSRPGHDLEEIRVEQLRSKVATAIRMRFVVLSFIAAMWSLLSVVGMEPWRHGCVAVLVTLVVVTFIRLQRDALNAPLLLPQRLRVFFPFVASVHGFMIIVTGGLFSPLLPILLLVMVISGSYWRSLRRAIAAPVTVTVVLTVMLVIEALDWVPSIPGLSPAEPSLAALLAMWSAMVLLSWVTIIVTCEVAEAHDQTARQLDSAYAALLDAHQERLGSLEALSSRVAHEIKNPLSAIKGLTQLLQRKGDPTGHLVVISGEVDRLEEILNGLLTFARPIDRLRVAELNLCDAVQGVLAILDARLEELEVDVEVDAPAEGVCVEADAAAVTQILLNLTLNALDAMKARPTGRRLQIEVALAGSGAVLRIRDTGPGLSGLADDPFRPYVSSKSSGTGLGLPISRTMARAHGGELELHDVPEGGAEAVLTLLRRPPQPQSDKEPS